jgi:rRNA maturation RNase YbeY
MFAYDRAIRRRALEWGVEPDPNQGLDAPGGDTADGPAPHAPVAGGLAVDLVDPHGALQAAPAEWLLALVRRAGDELRLSGEVRLRIVDDPAMSAAHKHFSGVPGTTDVLTFDERESADGPMDADILLCVDEARRQSDARGLSVERELLLYAIHALLHCAGHDDQDAGPAEAMHRREDEILTALGVGPTYRAPGRSAAC